MAPDRRLALLMIAVLGGTAALADADGGLDVPFADPDAGIYEVNDATQPDGGLLGVGWWLAPRRMQKVGEHITALENDNRRLKFDAAETFRPTFGFWIGMGAGFVLGAVGSVMIVKQAQR